MSLSHFTELPVRPGHPSRTGFVPAARAVRNASLSAGAVDSPRRGIGFESLLARTSAVRRRLRRGEYLYRAGDPFCSLFTIRAGSFKSVLLTEDGREQVTGFHLGGDVLGLDGIGLDVHAGDVVALEDSEVAEIPYAGLDLLAAEEPSVQQELFRLLSLEIQRERALMLLLGSMRAEERLASFLIDLSQRMAARGFSASSFLLRMTREEIGSMLGLKLETVSRILSRFQAEGLISVRNREIEILSMSALRAVIGRLEARRQPA